MRSAGRNPAAGRRRPRYSGFVSACQASCAMHERRQQVDEQDVDVCATRPGLSCPRRAATPATARRRSDPAAGQPLPWRANVADVPARRRSHCPRARMRPRSKSSTYTFAGYRQAACCVRSGRRAARRARAMRRCTRRSRASCDSSSRPVLQRLRQRQSRGQFRRDEIGAIAQAASARSGQQRAAAPAAPMRATAAADAIREMSACAAAPVQKYRSPAMRAMKPPRR